jgi:hypothetical protein
MFASRSKAHAVDGAPVTKTGEDQSSAQHGIDTPALQRTLGNSYLQANGLCIGQSCGCAACGTHQIQPKLTIGSVGDPYEQEADQVAQRVMRMADPRVQRRAGRHDETGEIAIQTKRATPQKATVSPDVEGQLRSAGSGQPLSHGARAFFEPRFGHDFSSVRVHIGEAADGLNRRLSARAFTMGEGIFFRQGEYKPDSQAGKELLAHELTHVVQQGGAVQRSVGLERSNGDPDAIRTLENDEDSEFETSVPDIQTDFAIEPPNPTADAAALTDAQVQEAIKYNTIKMRGADAALIGSLRDVLGIDPAPPSIDEDFVNAVARWQAANNLTQDGKLGPGTAAPLFAELRAEGLGAESTALANLIRRGKVRAGPTYTPNGVQAAIVAGGRKHLPFALAATFEHDPENGIFASCCEVRQEIEWDAAAAASFTAITGNPVPHAGFPPAHPVGTRIEDRNDGDTARYGHRTGLGGGVVGNRFVNAANNLDSANGARFQGNDNPQGPATMTGQWRFRLSVVDVCNENRQIGGTDTITINW